MAEMYRNILIWAKGIVKATINALSQMRDANEVARQRGVSLDGVFPTRRNYQSAR